MPSLETLINNAAIHGPIGSLWKNDWSLWTEVIQVNLLAPVALCHALVPLIKETKGSIINLSGGGATGPRANFSAYATAKAGLVRFSETLAEEVKSYDVRVNCIAPGPIRTDLLRGITDTQIEKITSQQIIPKQFQKSDVCDLVELLIDKKASSLSGQVLNVGGV